MDELQQLLFLAGVPGVPKQPQRQEKQMLVTEKRKLGNGNLLQQLNEAAIKQAVTEVSPKGWEGTVKAMKKHNEIENPWALSNSMKNKGFHSHKTKSGKPKKESLKEGIGYFISDEGSAISFEDFLKKNGLITALDKKNDGWVVRTTRSVSPQLAAKYDARKISTMN